MANCHQFFCIDATVERLSQLKDGGRLEAFVNFDEVVFKVSEDFRATNF